MKTRMLFLTVMHLHFSFSSEMPAQQDSITKCVRVTMCALFALTCPGACAIGCVSGTSKSCSEQCQKADDILEKCCWCCMCPKATCQKGIPNGLQAMSSTFDFIIGQAPKPICISK